MCEDVNALGVTEHLDCTRFVTLTSSMELNTTLKFFSFSPTLMATLVRASTSNGLLTTSSYSSPSSISGLETREIEGRLGWTILQRVLPRAGTLVSRVQRR